MTGHVISVAWIRDVPWEEGLMPSSIRCLWRNWAYPGAWAPHEVRGQAPWSGKMSGGREASLAVVRAFSSLPDDAWRVVLWWLDGRDGALQLAAMAWNFSGDLRTYRPDGSSRLPPWLDASLFPLAVVLEVMQS